MLKKSVFAVLALSVCLLFAVEAQTPGPGNRTVSLSWPAVATATGYNVYKAQAACAGATLAKITATPVTTPSYSETGLPDGATRCYYVTAVNAAGESTPSGTVQITTPTYTNPQAAAIPPPVSLAASSQ